MPGTGKRNIIVEVIGEFGRYVSGSKNAAKATGGLTSKVEAAGKAIALAYSAKKVVDFLGSTVKLAAVELKGQAMIEQAVKQNTAATDDQVAAVQKWIAHAELQYALTDDLLRPAFEALVRTTKDTAEAEDLLTLSLDVSRGTGKDLQSVAEALSKAYAGQTTALGRLVPGIRKAGETTLDFATAKDRLTAAFGGAAQTYADTDLGKMERLEIQYGNMKETIGMALIPAMSQLVGIVSGMFEWFNRLNPQQQQFLTIVGLTAAAVYVGVGAVTALRTAIGGLGVQAESTMPWLLAISAAVAAITIALNLFGDEEDMVAQKADAMTKAALQNAAAVDDQKAAMMSASEAAKEYGDTLFSEADQQIRDRITQNGLLRKAILDVGLSMDDVVSSAHDEAKALELYNKLIEYATENNIDLQEAVQAVVEFSGTAEQRGLGALALTLGSNAQIAGQTTDQLIDLAKGGQASAVVALKASGAWNTLDAELRDTIQTVLEASIAEKANLGMHLEWQASMEAAAAAQAEENNQMAKGARLADEHSAALQTTRDRMNETAQAASDLKSAIDAVFAPYMNMEEATRNLNAESDKLTATIQENGATLSLNTEAGRENREEIQGRVQSILDYTTAMVGAGATEEEAAAKANELTDGLVTQLEMLGFTEEQARDYIETLGLTPENVDTTVKLAQADATRRELEDLLGQLGDIDEGAKAEIQAEIESGQFAQARRDIDALAADRDIQLKVKVTGSGTIAVGGGSWQLRAYALGGSPPGGEPVVVGEHGPEIATFPAGVRIHRASAAARVLAPPGGLSGASGAAPINVYVAGSVITERELTSAVAAGVRQANRREARDTLSGRRIPIG